MSTSSPSQSMVEGQVTQTVTCSCGAMTSLTGSPEYVKDAVWGFLSAHEQCRWAKRVATLARPPRSWSLFR